MSNCQNCSSCCCQSKGSVSACELWRTGHGSRDGIRFHLRPPAVTSGCLWQSEGRMPAYRFTFLNARQNPDFRRWCTAITHLSINHLPYRWLEQTKGHLTGFTLSDDLETFLINPLAMAADDNNIIFHARGYDDLDLLISSHKHKRPCADLDLLQPPAAISGNYDRTGTRYWLAFGQQQVGTQHWLHQITDIRINERSYKRSSRTMPLKPYWYDFDRWGNLILSLDERLDQPEAIQITADGYRPFVHRLTAA